jgi:hypothetical protein
VLFAALAGQTAVRADGLANSAWQRTWTFVAVTCTSCAPPDIAALKSQLGAKLILSPDTIRNPFYQDCMADADYDDIRPRPAAAVRGFLGKSRLPNLRAATPLAGRLRCATTSGPPNVIGKIVIDTDRAYLLDESGAILILE